MLAVEEEQKAREDVEEKGEGEEENERGGDGERHGDGGRREAGDMVMNLGCRSLGQVGVIGVFSHGKSRYQDGLLGTFTSLSLRLGLLVHEFHRLFSFDGPDRAHLLVVEQYPVELVRGHQHLRAECRRDELPRGRQRLDHCYAKSQPRRHPSNAAWLPLTRYCRSVLCVQVRIDLKNGSGHGLVGQNAVVIYLIE